MSSRGTVDGGQVRAQFSAGVLVRRYVRAAFDEVGVEWVEHKGWLDSIFVVTATRGQVERLNAWIDDVNREERQP